jgi:hypothetical protein
MISLLNWMERVGRIKANPLKNVSRADERGKQKRVRRAFTDEELRKLVAGSEDRGIIYFTAARRWRVPDSCMTLAAGSGLPALPFPNHPTLTH